MTPSSDNTENNNTPEHLNDIDMTATFATTTETHTQPLTHQSEDSNEESSEYLLQTTLSNPNVNLPFGDLISSP
jgi:hypothetical protein